MYPGSPYWNGPTLITTPVAQCYRRKPATPDLSPTQKAAWQDSYPAINCLSDDRWMAPEEVLEQVRGYLACLRDKCFWEADEMRQKLDALVTAGLAEAKTL